MRDEGAVCVSVSRRFGVACVREPVGHCSRGSGREKWAPRSRPQVRSLPASICVRRPSPWRFDWERRMFSPSPRLSPASGSRPAAGLVTFEHRAFNQDETLVCRATRTALMHRRPT